MADHASSSGHAASTMLTGVTTDLTMPHTASLKDAVMAAGKDVIAGTVGGVAVVVAGHPFDTIKVRLQSSPHLYAGPMDCFWKTWRKDGVIRGLYAGSVPALAANMAENAVLFMCYQKCKEAIQAVDPSEAPLSNLQLASAGAMASVFASAVLCPTELVKCRLQATLPSGEPMFRGSWQCMKHIVRVEGARGLFRGMSSTFAREIPGNFAFFGGYELTRSLLTPEGGSVDDLSTPKLLFAGGMGGAGFWAASYPFDVVKTRIQVEGSPLSFRAMLGHIVRTEGVQALFRGISPTIIRAFPSNAALFASFELCRKFLG